MFSQQFFSELKMMGYFIHNLYACICCETVIRNLVKDSLLTVMLCEHFFVFILSLKKVVEKSEGFGGIW